MILTLALPHLQANSRVHDPSTTALQNHDALQEEGDLYADVVKKKSKRKGGGSASATLKAKSVRLSHSPEDFALWEKLGLKAPGTSDACVSLHEELLAKREV